MRLKSAIWVAAYLRRCAHEGAFAVVRRHGADDAGAIFIKIDSRDGLCALYGPAPQSEIDGATSRRFMANVPPGPDEKTEQYLEKQMRFDPDIWIVDVEDRQGRNFLDDIVR